MQSSRRRRCRLGQHANLRAIHYRRLLSVAPSEVWPVGCHASSHPSNLTTHPPRQWRIGRFAIPSAGCGRSGTSGRRRPSDGACPGRHWPRTRPVWNAGCRRSTDCSSARNCRMDGWHSRRTATADASRRFPRSGSSSPLPSSDTSAPKRRRSRCLRAPPSEVRTARRAELSVRESRRVIWNTRPIPAHSGTNDADARVLRRTRTHMDCVGRVSHPHGATDTRRGATSRVSRATTIRRVATPHPPAHGCGMARL